MAGTFLYYFAVVVRYCYLQRNTNEDMQICQYANIFVFIWQNNMSKVSHCTLLANCKFPEKNPHVHLIIIRERPKNNSPPILRKCQTLTSFRYDHVTCF